MNSNTKATSSTSENSPFEQLACANWTIDDRINMKHLSNEARIQIGQTLLSTKESVVGQAVSKEGDTLSARNKAAVVFRVFVENRMGLKHGTARSYMRIAERFSKRPDIVRLFRWRDLEVLVSYDDEAVNAAIGRKLESTEMSDAEFGKTLRS